MQRGGLADSMWFDFVFSLTFVYFYELQPVTCLLFHRLRHPETAIPLGHNDYSVFLVVDYTFNKSTRRN